MDTHPPSSDTMSLMKPILPLLFAFGTCFALRIFSPTAEAALVIDFSLSAPGVQQSPLQGQPGSLTENFNSLSVGTLPASGTLAVGSYTSTGISIENAGAWGGAGGVGRYASTSDNKNLSITLTPSKYLGFWWSAGNTGNLVKIFGAGDALLGTFNSSSITTYLGPKLSPNNVLAADGQVYSGALYYGNPNGDFGASGSNNEPYAYVNLRLNDPTATFTRIEFSGSGFEFDNVTTSVNYYDPTAVPEPAQVASSILLLSGIGIYVWVKRRNTYQARISAKAS